MNRAPQLQPFEAYLQALATAEQRDQLTTVLNWVVATFPQLTPRLAWNQPMFTDHGTFIVGFSAAKPHFNVALEAHTLNHFRAEITANGDRATKMLWQINYHAPINWALLEATIQYNLTTKADHTKFWR
ncbi:iron chaperone [Lactiplantibacillus modestisalitolerans]|uniref:Iron chaperone n=1 Tax=Lactiplantibacillus modestisalitolerans TaxID=1457219 RepID=A0ABV5WWD7_9LACO|nr:DUF1801 domain-containing protein [Lactiplantibacillus modestisalitolerans]